jgi:hypothetical protein
MLKGRLSPVACAAALVALGCSHEVRFAQPVAMSPMTDATLRVELDRLLVPPSLPLGGFSEYTPVDVVLAVTNASREPYLLNAASISCWLELSPDQPGETRGLTPVGGGEGSRPGGNTLGSTTIWPGETRRFWVRFGGYRYPGSDVPRKITIFLPDARGRRVQLVIADPARGQRWMVDPMAFGVTYGIQQTTLSSSELNAQAIGAQLGFMGRLGPVLWDLGVNLRLLHQREGRLLSETSGFSGIGWSPHLALPFFHWGPPQWPLALGIWGGGEAQYFNEISRAGPDMGGLVNGTYGALSAEGGAELHIGGRPPAPSPFPISFTRRSLPSWTVRAGYAHWWVSGNQITANAGGLTTTIRFMW